MALIQAHLLSQGVETDSAQWFIGLHIQELEGPIWPGWLMLEDRVGVCGDSMIFPHVHLVVPPDLTRAGSSLDLREDEAQLLRCC